MTKPDLIAALEVIAVDLPLDTAETVIERDTSKDGAAGWREAAASPNLDRHHTTTHHHIGIDIVRAPFAARAGPLEVPGGPGLGLEIDPGRLAELRRR